MTNSITIMTLLRSSVLETQFSRVKDFIYTLPTEWGDLPFFSFVFNLSVELKLLTENESVLNTGIFRLLYDYV